MGKKLRNREILDQTDEEVDNNETLYPIIASLTKNKLKKIISKKFRNKCRDQSQRVSNYFKNLQNNQICSVIDQSKLQCPICLELMVKPTMMACGHMYCYRCLESNTAHSQRCCMCRQQQRDEPYISSVFAQNLINEVLLPRSNEFIKYLCRTTDTTEWAKRRQLNNIRPGVVVDYQDGFNVWRRALVMKTFVEKDQKFMLNLRMNIKGTLVFETVEASSKRLAPCNFFTRGRYLEQYAPSLPEYDLYEKELNELQYRRCDYSQEFFRHQYQQNVFDENQPQVEPNQVNQQFVDEALALFDWEMNGTQLQY